MKNCRQRQLLSIVLVLTCSGATLGADGPISPRAVLHASGKVQVNGAGSRTITALFPGDSIQTEDNSVANISATGSSILVKPNALVKFLGNAVEVDQGEVAIATSSGFSAQADGLTMTPATEKQSKFEVADNEDAVVVAARQGNVAVSDGQQTSTVPEGQQTTKKKKGAGTVPAATTGSSFPVKTVAIVGGTAAALAVTGIVIANSGGSKKCVSPSGDKKCCTQNQQGNNNCQ